jgi:transposase
MLTQEDDVEIHALKARGWSVSAIGRHTGRDRKTIRKYLAGEGAGQSRRPAASCLEPYRDYLAARFEDDAHIEATVLFRELVAAGFDRSYPTLVRELRRLELRPVCLVCEHRRGEQVTVEIEHPPGEEIQWDWLELHATPWGEPAFVLLGALSHSGRFRGVFCEQMIFGHLAEAMHRVLVALGGTPRIWRTDRMATIVISNTDRLTVDAANAAKHYGVDIAVCPARRAQRKGVVEAAGEVHDEVVVAHRAGDNDGRGAGILGSLEPSGRRRAQAPGRDRRAARRRRAAARAAARRLSGGDRC